MVQEVVWAALARRVGGEALATDERFAVIQNRRKNQKEMWRLLEQFASDYTKWEIMALLNEIDVPCGPIMATDDLANDEHVRGREM